ncbi:MAG TPA: ABC transporter permease [Gaiellaceae bacterium]|jgi:peptide/nickel transport system permease protein
MTRLILRRLVTLPFVLAGVAVILFVVSQVLPADTVRLVAGDSVPPAVRAAIAHNLGIDRPIWVQFWLYIDRLLHGNLGVSIRFQLPVNDLIRQALPASLELVAAATVVAILIAFPIGILAARYRGTWFDVVSRVVVVVGTSTPAFFLGVLTILIFGYYLRWFPVAGRGTPPDLSHLVMPACVLGFREASSTARILRARMIDELNEDHAKAARARGMSGRSVLIQSGFRNALLPAITDLGVSLTELVGSLVLIETVFSWPGIGNLLYIGVQWNDFPLVSGAVLVLVLYAVLVNLTIDLLYGFIDPRLRA